MRYATLLAKSALAPVLPFILAHCASLRSERLPPGRRRMRQGLGVLAALLAAGVIQAVPSCALAQQRETISFESRNRGKPIQLSAEIYWPAGQGPVAAMVIHHGSGGWSAMREGRFAREMAAMGVAGVVIDSFKARDIISTWADQSQVSRLDFIVDALRALKALGDNPRIDPKRIGIMGFSKGGLSALYSAQERFVELAGVPVGLRFALHVPFYPLCLVYSYKPTTSGAPIYMLIGGNDTWVGAEPCTSYAEVLRANGARVEAKVYARAMHQFDGGPTNYARRAENPSKCRYEEQSDGSFIERTSGLAVAGANGWPDEAGTAWNTCRTYGAAYGSQQAAAEQSLADLKSYVRRHLLGI